jgi:hypothetical protein
LRRSRDSRPTTKRSSAPTPATWVLPPMRSRVRPTRARRTIAELKAGMAGVNSFALAASEAPFGGTNFSGMGREGGVEGIPRLSRCETGAKWCSEMTPNKLKQLWSQGKPTRGFSPERQGPAWRGSGN